MLKKFSVSGLVVVLSLLFGFITAANPNFFPLHILVIAIIIGAMVLGYSNQASGMMVYARAALVRGFIVRAMIALMIYFSFIGVGAWLYTPQQATRDDLMEGL